MLSNQAVKLYMGVQNSRRVEAAAARPPRGLPGTGMASLPLHFVVKASHGAAQIGVGRREQMPSLDGRLACSRFYVPRVTHSCKSQIP